VFTIVACFITYKVARRAELRKEETERTNLLSEIRSDIAVIKAVINDFEQVKADQREDHDRIVIAEKDIEKNGDDINAQHSKIRDCHQRCDDIDTAISSIGRLENG